MVGWCHLFFVVSRCVCNLLLGLARAVTLLSITHGHILLSHSRLPNLKGQVPICISLRNRVVQLYHRPSVPFSSPLTARRATIYLDFPIYLQSADTFSKWRVGKRGRVEQCSVAPLRNKRVKTLCGCRGKKGTNHDLQLKLTN
jgi:hypothetical protein